MVNEDLSIFAADPVLTSLADLNVKNLHAAIESGIPPGLLDAPVRSYRISNLRYSPHEKMIVGLTSVGSQKPISLRIFPREVVGNRLEKARRSHPDHTFLLDNLNAIAWIFPGERKLKLDMLDQREILAELLLKHRSYDLTDVQLMHFVPEHTYTARVLGQRRDGTAVREYIKIYYNDQGADTAELMKCLLPQIGPTQIRIPNDVCYVSEHRLLIQSELKRLPDQMLSGRAAAAALAAFHKLVGNTKLRAVTAVQDEHRHVLGMVGKVFPGLIGKLGDLSDTVLVALADSPRSPKVLLHGDAHLGNLYPIANDRVGVIDLDRVAMGRPEEDLATFLAFKIWCRLREKSDAEAVLWALPGFVATYNTNAAVTVRASDVYVMLAHKMITERIRRGIVRGKISDARDILDFIRVTQQSLDKAAHCYD